MMKTSPKKRSRQTLTALTLVAASIAWSETASAQGWLADRRFTEGAGIKAGELELHPGVGGEVGYDSNYFLRSSNTGANIINGAPAVPPADAAVFRLTPSFYVSTIGSTRLAESGQPAPPSFFKFRGGISATGRVMI